MTPPAWGPNPVLLGRHTKSASADQAAAVLAPGSRSTKASTAGDSCHGRLQGVVEVVDDVVDVLDADGDADHVVAYARRVTLVVGHLLVRGRRRMDDQGLGVADVRQVRRQVHRVDEP